VGRRLREAFMEVAGPVLPVAVVVVFLQLVVVKAPGHLFARFGAGVALVIVGLFLFLVGVRMGLIPVGEYIGARLPGMVRTSLLVAVVFALGFVATVAEPDVRVLSDVVGDVSGGRLGTTALVLVIGIGLGIALAGAVIRQILETRLALVFSVGYAMALTLFLFISQEFIAISLDSGATTTGPLTVPLILSIGLGVARNIAKRNSLEDGFGLVGIASLGPVLLLAIVALFL